MFVDYFKNQKADINEVEMKEVLTRYGNDVIASVAFGFKINSLKDRNNNFYLMGKEATNFGGFWKTLKFFGYSFAPKLYEVRFNFKNIIQLCCLILIDATKVNNFQRSRKLILKYFQACKLSE